MFVCMHNIFIIIIVTAHTYMDTYIHVHNTHTHIHTHTHTHTHMSIYTRISAPRTCLCEDHDDHQVNDSGCDGCEDLSMLFQELFSTTIDDSYNRYAIYYCSQNSSQNNNHLHCNHVALNMSASDSHLDYIYEVFPDDLEKVNMVFSQ
jgi:hypothetical protein